MLVEELWRPVDEAAAMKLRQALKGEGGLASALLAVERADDRQARQVEAALDLLAARVQARASDAIDQQVAALRAVLRGFEGDRDSYYAPQNSHLSRVLERRRGLPILLSSLWMLVGTRAGLQVHGVGLPGHFIARVGGDQGLLVDPFSGGIILDREVCRRHVERALQGRGSFHEDHLRPVTLLELIERVLRNLLNAHRLQQEPAERYRIAMLWASLRPDLDEPRQELAAVEAALSLGKPGSRPN
jgi:regulator of sirC expression with transglutaminase-like and TPR domain